jgi:hypothetical protein
MGPQGAARGPQGGRKGAASLYMQVIKGAASLYMQVIKGAARGPHIIYAGN